MIKYLVLSIALLLFLMSVTYGMSIIFILLVKPRFFRPKYTIRGYPNGRQNRVPNSFSEEETGDLLSCFEEAWVDVYGTKPSILHDTLNNIDIIWSDELVKISKPFVVNGERVSHAAGLTNNSRKVTVWINNFSYRRDMYENKVYGKDGVPIRDYKEARIENTALAHELVHLVLLNIYGKADYDHEDSAVDLWNKDHTSIVRLTNEKMRKKSFDPKGQES